MDDKTLLIECLGSSPVLRIIDFFLDNRLFDYSKNELVKNLGVSRGTFFKYWKELERFGIVKVTRKIGKSTLYRLNEENEVVKKLIALDSALCKQAMDRYVESEKERIPVPA